MKTAREFRPVTITIETQEEFDRIYALFNYSPLLELSCVYNEVYQQLRPLAGDHECNTEMFGQVKSIMM